MTLEVPTLRDMGQGTLLLTRDFFMALNTLPQQHPVKLQLPTFWVLTQPLGGSDCTHIWTDTVTTGHITSEFSFVLLR